MRYFYHLIPLLLVLFCPCLVHANKAVAGVRPDDYREFVDQARTMTIAQIKAKGAEASARGDQDTALTWWRCALTRSSEGLSASEKQALAAIYSNYAGYLLHDQNNTSAALTYLMKARALEKEQARGGFALAGLYVNLGNLYAMHRENSKALEYFKEGFYKNLSSKTPQNSSMLFTNMVYLAWNVDSLGAIAPERRKFAAAPLARAPMWKYNTLLNMAVDAYLEGNYTQSASLFEDALGMVESANAENRYLAQTYLMQARAMRMAGDARRALEALQKAQTIVTRKSPNLDIIRFVTAEKVACYRSLGQMDMAEHCEYEGYRLTDSIFNIAKYAAIKDIEAEQQTAEIDARLSRSEAERQSMQTERDRLRAIVVIVSVAALIIIALLLFIVRYHRRLAGKNRDLYLKNIQLAGITPAPLAEPEQESVGPEAAEIGAEEKEVPVLEESDPDEMKRVFAQVKEATASRPEIFNPEFTIQTMADITGLKKHEISAAVNQLAGKNFGNFMAEFRIMEACRLLSRQEGRDLPTVDAVSVAVGYKSRSHFSRVFKTVTGLTPTEFIRQAQQQ